MSRGGAEARGAGAEVSRGVPASARAAVSAVGADVFERELSLLILHLNHNQKPNVKKRKGTFKKHKLKVKNGEKISMPQGEPSRQIKLMIIITLSLLTS